MLKALTLAMAVALFGATAFGASFETEPTTKTVTRVGKNLRGDAIYNLTVDANVYEITTVPQLVDELVYDCEDSIIGDGRGDWKGFYEAPKELKAARLAEAIKGVGLSTAQRLVKDGYFHTKPRSWREFADRIESADNRYNTGFSTAVLVTYKRENMANLGYFIEGKCGYKTVRSMKMVPHRTFARTVSRGFELRVRNAPLLLGESESFNVTFDGLGDSLGIESYYNGYTYRRYESGRAVVYELLGNRKVVAPNNSLNVAVRNAGGYVALSVSDTTFDPEVDTRGTRVIVGTVEIKKGGWRSNESLARFERRLEPNRRDTEITDLQVAIPQGQTVVVRYQLRYEGNPYYSSEPSTRKEARLK
jgi:hypothetical protein